jgi:drug/metabolite transporter (DMT)-like permease
MAEPYGQVYAAALDREQAGVLYDMTVAYIEGTPWMAMAPFAMAELQATTIVWRPEVSAAFAYVAVFPSLCAYFLYNAAVAQIGAGAAGQTISLMPVFGALLATQLLDEQLRAYHALGMAMILSGIALAWRFGAETGRSPGTVSNR